MNNETPTAAEIGRIGGKKKVPKGLATMSKQKAKAIRKLAAAARQKKKLEERE